MLTEATPQSPSTVPVQCHGLLPEPLQKKQNLTMQPGAPEDESQWNFGYTANVTPTFSLETTTEIQRKKRN